jgi:hypothetical protein
MIKPIAVIYIPYDSILSSSQTLDCWSIAASFNGVDPKYSMPRELYQDYLWFCFPTEENEVKLEVFHPKDFTEIQYNELKELITKEIKQLKNA